jgi:hypothetical protein
MENEMPATLDLQYVVVKQSPMSSDRAYGPFVGPSAHAEAKAFAIAIGGFVIRMLHPAFMMDVEGIG